MVYHREVPDDATIKEVVVKQELTGEWFAVLRIETENDAPPNPQNPEKCVGIDVGILKYAHDSDGTAVEGPAPTDERDGSNAHNATSHGRNTGRTTTAINSE